MDRSIGSAALDMLLERTITDPCPDTTKLVYIFMHSWAVRLSKVAPAMPPESIEVRFAKQLPQVEF